MLIKINIIFGVILCVFLNTWCFAFDNTLKLHIDGEVYEREYPTTYEEAIGLIDSLVDMHNELDGSFIKYQKLVEDEQIILNQKLDMLKENNEYYKELVITVNKEIQKVTHYINSLRNVKNNIGIHAMLGPVYNFEESIFGSAIGVGILKNLNLFNLYGGLNINTTIYYQVERNILPDFGISLYLGMFLK
jgi:hypothetical protein